MKNKLKKLIRLAIFTANQNGDLPSDNIPEIEIEEPKATLHGDFSTNVAMISASIQKMPPRKIAEIIIQYIEKDSSFIEKMEIAGPGFINFFINYEAWYPVLHKINQLKSRYGSSEIGQGKKIQVEFVSANPTGPLHVGHGRGAAVGDSMASILAFCGYDVEREYYINDSGRQINTLGQSVFIRYQQQLGVQVDFPENCYQGDYISQYAAGLIKKNDKSLLDLDEKDAVALCASFAAKNIFGDIKSDLLDFGVKFDQWFSEQSLFDNKKVDQSIKAFKEQNIIYEKDGALWFKTEKYGDEKDRVVVRKNGLSTYFASDIAYHQDKFRRGFEQVIDVWGADHHGYIQRMKAAVEGFGYHPDQLEIILVQLVNLLRAGEPVAMSTRAGEFVTLKDVVKEVGKDAARFIFLTRSYDSPLDFDLDLAQKKSNDNPVYYVQYVHARICSIIRKDQEQTHNERVILDPLQLNLLKTPEEIKLIKSMARYPEVVENSAKKLEPHRITYFLMELAATFHAYYNKHRVLTEKAPLTAARLYLILAVKQIINNGLGLLGVFAPEKM